MPSANELLVFISDSCVVMIRVACAICLSLCCGDFYKLCKSCSTLEADCLSRVSIAHQIAIICHNDKLTIQLPIMLNYGLLFTVDVGFRIKIHSSERYFKSCDFERFHSIVERIKNLYLKFLADIFNRFQIFKALELILVDL
jgi:hypothetical protein